MQLQALVEEKHMQKMRTVKHQTMVPPTLPHSLEENQAVDDLLQKNITESNSIFCSMTMSFNLLKLGITSISYVILTRG